MTTGYIIPGGLPALNTKGGWLIVYGQQTAEFSEPVQLAVDQHPFHSRLRRALALIESEPDTAGLYSAACELRAVLGMHAGGVPGTSNDQQEKP